MRNLLTKKYLATVKAAKKTLSRITMSCFGVNFKIFIAMDKKFTIDHFNLDTGKTVCKEGRMYLQVAFTAPCTKTGKVQLWKGRKYYLSAHMTQDEIVKTAFVAFKSAVEHEVMEGFKVDGKIVFNPHVNFEALLAISDKEITRG